MIAETQSTAEDLPRCWCCDREFPESELMHLGAHPEVAVCLDCARWLNRNARARYDQQHTRPGRRVRAAIAAVRERVIRRGLHNRRFLGPLLRRLDRWLP